MRGLEDALSVCGSASTANWASQGSAGGVTRFLLGHRDPLRNAVGTEGVATARPCSGVPCKRPHAYAAVIGGGSDAVVMLSIRVSQPPSFKRAPERVA